MSLYGLPHPSTILSIPPTKSQWARLVRKSILSHWQSKLATEAAPLSSLSFLRASHLSLSRPHLLWTTCPPGPLPSRQASLMARILSGRYQSCWLRRHWDGSNGACRLPSCGKIPGDIVHLFGGCCPTLLPEIEPLAKKLTKCISYLSHLASLLSEVTAREPISFTQFFVDPSTDPQAIKTFQFHGQEVWDKLFYISHSWLFTIHRARYRLLGLSSYLV